MKPEWVRFESARPLNVGRDSPGVDSIEPSRLGRADRILTYDRPRLWTQIKTEVRPLCKQHREPECWQNREHRLLDNDKTDQ
jgi:hypothetical protein